jgi:colanic acid/amylovoran biosynthesis glycosyltransferase
MPHNSPGLQVSDQTLSKPLLPPPTHLSVSRQKHLHRADSGTVRRIAYLVSEYPKVSHSFIRREIRALEKRGWQILRLSIRGWNSVLVDPADIDERDHTLFVLKGGLPALVAAMGRAFILKPRRFLKALFLAMRMMVRSDRPFIWHLIYLAEASWIVPQLEKRGITHFHAHFGTNPAEVAMLVSELSGMTYSLTIHGPEEFDRAPSIHLTEKVRRAELVIAVSSYGRSQLFRLVEQKYWKKIQIVHCGIDQTFAAVSQMEKTETARLVCVGRLCEQKGQLLLIEAAAILAREGRAFELVLVGDGEHRPLIEELIVRHDLERHVRITGWATADRVRGEMLAARGFVLPSFAEGLPVVLMEAMALGCPVLTTYVAGIPELVIDGKTGWLFPAGSVEDLTAAMRACLDSPHHVLRVMGESARARALQRHHIDDQAAKLDSLFASILGSESSRC